MRRWQHIIRRWFNLALTRLGTTRIIALMFLVIILTGTALLMTPWATRDGLGCGFTPALFTATSATCVTGLVMYDTWTQFSFFGQIVILCLIQIGGLGFFVWEELVRKRSFKALSVYSKLVLIITASLLTAGTAAILLTEWNNPATLGSMSGGDKLLNAFLQSVTVRTAGFAAIDQAALTDSGKIVSVLLMLIGGSSGSTAGGMKTVTLMVMILFVWARARGRETVSVFKRTIPNSQILDAMTITVIMTCLAVFGGLFISASSGFPFVDGLYEAASAIATVGLSAAGSPNLNTLCKYLIVMYMYFGRVGILTISLGFLGADRVRERFRYAETKLLIG